LVFLFFFLFFFFCFSFFWLLQSGSASLKFVFGMSKQVVRFSVKVQLEQASGVGGVDGVVVEWKRGKHHGISPSAPVKGTSAVWGEHEILIPCTMYFLPKKRAFEEKSLSLVLSRGVGALKPFGRVSVSLDNLAMDMADAAIKTFKRKDMLDGLVELEFSLTLKRLVDPRDKGGIASVPSSPMPVRGVAIAIAGPARATALTEESVGLAESPLQSIEAPRLATPDAPLSSPAPRKMYSVQSQTDHGTAPAGLSVLKDKEFGYASSGGIPSTGRHERTGSATPSPMPIPIASSGHSRGPSAAAARAGTGLLNNINNNISNNNINNNSDNSNNAEVGSPGALLQRSSEIDVSSISGGGSSRVSKKGILGGAGHRRGKSHAVTPDELRGLHAGGDLRQQQQFAGPVMVGSVGSARKSNAANLASKLGFKRTESRGSVSSTSTPLSPRSLEQAKRRSTSNGPSDFLVVENMSESSSSSDFEEDLVMSQGGKLAISMGSSGSGGSPARSSSHSTPSSPMPVITAGKSEHREEIEFYQRQLADHGRRRDQSYILQQFVAFCQPMYSKSISVSAWVLFRCLAEWDCFSNDGREFREQLLEGFEQLSKNAMDQHHQLYWMSTLLSLLFLLRNKLRPLPRSDVHRTTALTVFQERLRGLASALCARAALVVVNELRPMVSAALLEHALLEDAGAGPRGGRQQQPHPVQPTQPRVSIGSMLGVLDQFRSGMASAHISAGVAAQIISRVAHGVTAIALNTLLDNNPRLCTFSNGLQMKKPVVELRAWMTRFQLEAAVTELAPLEEVVNVLCMNKSALVEPEVRNDVCPHLTPSQLSQLLLLYTPDSFDNEPIHPKVLAALCGDQMQDFKMEAELRTPFVFDLTIGSYDLLDIEIPKTVVEQASLGFLSKPYTEDDAMSDAW
jgi:hypothetical protein